MISRIMNAFVEHGGKLESEEIIRLVSGDRNAILSTLAELKSKKLIEVVCEISRRGSDGRMQPVMAYRLKTGAETPFRPLKAFRSTVIPVRDNGGIAPLPSIGTILTVPRTQT